MYHVTLAGQGLLLDLQSYSRALAEPFAGKVASGERTYGDLTQELVVAVDDWSGGEGFPRFDPALPERYRSGPGADGFSEPGALLSGMHSVVITSGVGDPRPAPMVAALGKLYVGIHGGFALAWDGAAATTPFALASGGSIASLAEFQGKLYVGKSGNGEIGRWDGAAFTNVFTTLPAPVTACYSQGVFYRGSLGYLYLAGDATDGARIYYTDGVSLSTLRYQLNEPAVRVAPQVFGQTCLFFGSSLTAAARTGVYSLIDSGGSEKWAFDTGLPGVAMTAGSVLGEASYLGGFRGTSATPEIYRWESGRLERRMHPLDAPYSGGALAAAATGNGAWWLGFSSGGVAGARRFDGNGWSEPVAAGGAGSGQVLSLAWYAGDLYSLSYQSGTNSWTLTRHRVGAYAASATLETGRIDLRLPGVSKVWRSVTLNHAPLTSGQSVQALYRLDDTGAWTALGTSSTAGGTSATFTCSGATVSKLLSVRLVLAGAAGAASPVKIYGLEIRARAMPGAKREWQFECLVEGSPQAPLILLDGSNAPQTGAQLSAALWGMAGQSGPLTYVDLDGVSRSVWLLEYRESSARQSQRMGTQLRGRIRLLEA